MQNNPGRKVPKSVRFVLAPLAFYFAAYCVITFPLILKFSTHFFTGKEDGLQNVWNLWWVHKAVTELHQLPWHTTYLRYPDGTSLLAHTLNPFNGFLGIPLQIFLTLVQTHNAIVLFSFIAGGLTAFCFAHHLTRAYWPSIACGYIFTFSSYHFTHAEAHLQLVALEWLPLFLLCWHVYLSKPSVRMALASAGVLFLIQLCDFYYLLFSIWAGAIMVIGAAAGKKDAFFLIRKRYRTSVVVFVASSLALCGPLIAAFFLFIKSDPLAWGSHAPTLHSVGLFGAFIPGGHWRFHTLTEPYWSRLPGNIGESSVHLGLGLTCILVYAWRKRKVIALRQLRTWYAILIFFLLMSFGPVLQIWGQSYPQIKMPYALAELIFPPLKLSGNPQRMMVMVILMSGIIAAGTLRYLAERGLGKSPWIFVLLFVTAVEFLPKPPSATRIEEPGYVKALNSLPDKEAVFDLGNDYYHAMYAQTLHERPIAMGYISRLSRSVVDKAGRLMGFLETRQYDEICRTFDIRYFVYSYRLDSMLKTTPDSFGAFPLIYDEKNNVRLYDLKRDGACIDV